MIEELKDTLNQCIIKYGRLANITINVSQQLDKIIVEEQKKMIDKNNSRRTKEND